MDATQSAEPALTNATIEDMIDAIVTKAAERISAASERPGGLDMHKAWVDQRGESWYCAWYEPGGKQRRETTGPGAQGEKAARKLQRKIEAQLIEGTYQSNTRKTWQEFRREYDSTVVPGKAKRTQEEIKSALDDFERLTSIVRMVALKSSTVDAFIAKRRKERGKWPGTTVSPATLNKQLRHLRAAFRKAAKWEYLSKVPDFDFERTVERLVRYVLPEHFDAIYNACEVATFPIGQAYPPSDWWRAAVIYLYMTGWRIGELLALPRSDIDLKTGHSITRGDDNKGKRDERIPLHPAIVEHLERLAGFGERMFPWPIEGNPTWKKELYAEWAKIQKAAGIHLDCPKRHEHTDACHRYGFHDLRRAFATENAADMEPKVLQKWMRHKSFSTTMVYQAMPQGKLDATLGKLRVPDVLKRKATG